MKPTLIISLFSTILILFLSCGERNEPPKELSNTQQTVPQEQPAIEQPVIEPEKVLTDEERANEFLKGTWIGSNNLDYYIFTGSKLIKQTEEGRIVVRTGYRVFFAGETEIRLKFEDGSKGSILKMGDELLFGKETLKKKSDSTMPIK